MLLEPTIDKLIKMRLHAMADSIKSRLARADHADLAASDFISLVVDDEWNGRQNRMLSKRLKAAGFKDKSACVENIDYHHPRGIQRSALLELAQCRWIEAHQNLAIVGYTGIGKSYLAQALGNQACRLGYSVAYVRVPKLFEQILLARADGSLPRWMSRLAKSRLLILDDFGLATLQEQESRDLLEIIEDRTGSGSTLLTSQLPVEAWHECLGGGVVADAICERLVHTCVRLKLEGESIRKSRQYQSTTCDEEVKPTAA